MNRPSTPATVLANRHQERAASRAAIEVAANLERLRAAETKAHLEMSEVARGLGLAGQHAITMQAAAERYAKARALRLIAGAGAVVPASSDAPAAANHHPLSECPDSEGGVP